MSSSSKTDPSRAATHDEEAEATVPPALVAQAEAAILGQFENGTQAGQVLRPPPSNKDYSSYESMSQGGLSKSRSKQSYLEVPNILAQEGSAEAPPAYGDHHDQIDLNQDGFNTKAKVTDDGRININIHQKTRKLSDLLVPALRNQLSLVAQEEATPLPPGYIPPALGGHPGQTPPPRLNVVIHVVGSRGDVQPFVALGKTLKATYGHRVRLATHGTFQTFVEENGLEFFSIGGDPSELMAFMVKNPGLMPGFESLKSGDVGKRRKGMEDIVLGCWRSCIEAGNGLGPPLRNDSDASFGFEAGINMETKPGERPFIADAIIANPPSFAHVHIAEKMGIPLHMMFTMPWSPTQQFPHPLANIQSSNADVNMTNFVSYALVEMMTWQGLGDVINRFREKALGLDPISLIWAPGMLSRIRVPFTYCWAPALIPKPKDWGQHISISGFFFLSLASSFTPEPELAAFLRDGPPPVYIGFGSIVVDDPNAMTKLIFDAVKKAGIRALVSKGWGGLGADALGIPEGVYMLGNVPHDWLFQHVSCVVHHGGAGTTAAGIALGRPTVVVPFFGDQPFWGAMVARAGAGPLPIPYKQMTSDKLAAAITEALKGETLAKAQELGASIKEEKGTEVGGKAFHDMLDVDHMRCSLAPSRVAVWRIKRTQTRLSALAANILASDGLLEFSDLKLHRSKEYETEDGPWDPISGGASALLGTIASLTMGVADFPIEIFRSAKAKKDSHTVVKEEPSSDPTTPTLSPQAQMSGTLVTDGSVDSGSAADIASLHHSTSEPSTKTSYESTERSSIDTPTSDTPLTSTTSLGGEHRIGSLRQALRGTLPSRPGSRSGSRERGSESRSTSRDGTSSPRSGSPRRSLSHRNSSPMRKQQKEFDPSTLTIENAIGAGKGVSRIVGAGLKSPMDFTLGVARGFHNAPKLYGDDTVRPQEKVTDFQSGLKAAGKAFGLGVYDGISGLATQPIRGAEKEGAAGLFKGIGKGIGGLILKPSAAVWSIPGYTFMGIHKEVRKLFGASVMNYIIAARTAQGFEDAKTATPEERLDIIARWREHKQEYQNVRQNILDQGGPEGQGTGHLSPRGFLQTRHLSFDERKRLHDGRKKKREEERNKVQGVNGAHCPFCRRNFAHKHTPRDAQETPIVSRSSEHLNSEFEHSIHASVEATSRGNAEEDMMIERAIRASVRELQNAEGPALTDQDALERAIKASVAEASRRRSTEAADPGNVPDEDSQHHALLEKAIQQSLLENRLQTRDVESGEIADSDEDENIKLAIQRSKEDSQDEDSDVELALQNSKVETEELSKAKTEEEIVLEYVKKQSLLEEEHRRKVQGKQRESSASDADEDALQQAIAESLKAKDESGPSHA